MITNDCFLFMLCYLGTHVSIIKTLCCCVTVLLATYPWPDVIFNRSEKYVLSAIHPVCFIVRKALIVWSIIWIPPNFTQYMEVSVRTSACHLGDIQLKSNSDILGWSHHHFVEAYVMWFDLEMGCDQWETVAVPRFDADTSVHSFFAFLRQLRSRPDS